MVQKCVTTLSELLMLGWLTGRQWNAVASGVGGAAGGWAEPGGCPPAPERSLVLQGPQGESASSERTEMRQQIAICWPRSAITGLAVTDIYLDMHASIHHRRSLPAFSLRTRSVAETMSQISSTMQQMPTASS